MSKQDKDLLKLREQLVREIRQEMLGPGSEMLYDGMDIGHEIITDMPEVRYSVGVLYPRGNTMNIASDDTLDPDDTPEVIDEIEVLDESIDDESVKAHDSKKGLDDAETTSFDDVVGLSAQNKPSSMGITFFAKGNLNSIKFNIRFATYKASALSDCVVSYNDNNGQVNLVDTYVTYEESKLKLKSSINRKIVRRLIEEDKINDEALKDALYKLANQCSDKSYVRDPHNIPVEVDFTDGDYNEKNDELDGTKLKLVVMRRPFKENKYAITAMLVNTDEGKYNGKNSIFQPEIYISTEDNSFCIERYDDALYSNDGDEEEISLALLYRNKKVYATGHGVSAHWEVDESGKGFIRTEFLPEEVVPLMDFDLTDEKINKNALSMKYLSDLNDVDINDKISYLMELVNAYKNWIVKITKESQDLPNTIRKRADEHIKDCNDSLERILYGINLIHKNDKVRAAFLLANRAMYMQRIHGELQQKDSYPENEELQTALHMLNYNTTEDKYHWRPFQIAFLLMSLRSVVEPEAEERDLVDLIWFPTGGGKTEAYLGLTAFTIFFRRLTFPESSGGTSVIMRYTLRLLAAQQFVRASILICACEAIRKGCKEKISKYPKYPLGDEPITIGLWIGGEHTPNKNLDPEKGAKFYVDKLWSSDKNNLRHNKEKYNKFQMLKCPWCGTKLTKDNDEFNNIIGSWGYKMENERHFYLACPQEGCKFHNRLPIQVVDEELYANPPTLLFGTVDKFAMITWKEESNSFFAVGDNNRCPELIIQDELHLISGPLGTIVGLYETAIDALCSHKGVKPKIIASTATIRRAKEQCRSLYNREVKQFPAPGIDSDDSFFAREASNDIKPGRLYLGIMPSGKTKAMMEVRVISSILQRVNMMDFPDEVKDKYWTLAVYFNSLRDLGSCSTRVDDDVKDFIRRIALRLGTRKDTRPIGAADELTSRISTTQLNETLERLERLNYSAENQKAKKYAISVLLASNMISVGVDVARLNVMTIMGQPKLTSEYIQASSRIGRSYPGVAFVVYDASKSRDRSHYEQFKPYHESFYRYVEPTSVTPFSKPARERALHSVQISLVRHLHGLSSDKDARYFNRDSEKLKEIEKYILQRIDSIRRNSTFVLSDDSQVIEQELKSFWDEWENRINLADYTDNKKIEKDFVYGDKYMVHNPLGEAKRLIKVFGNSCPDKAKETLTSMRNVDKNVATRMLVWGGKNE